MIKCKTIFFDFFKIRQTLLLVLSGLLGYLISDGRNASFVISMKLVTALFLTIAGTTGFNMIIDRDIDKVMSRTMRRPIPQGKITINEAYIYSLGFLSLGLIICYTISWWILFAGLLGFIVDILVYSILLKRRSWASALIGGIAGGSPIFGGYMAGRNANLIDALLFLTVIALWSAMHIWFISIYYKEDFKTAAIPTMPIVKGEVFTAQSTLVLIAIIISCVFILYQRGIIGPLSIIVNLGSSMRLCHLVFNFLKRHEKTQARKVYKFLTIYLAINLLIMSLEKTLLI